MLSQVSIPQYIRFVIHSLEYKTLVIEQLSEVRERAALAIHHKNQAERQAERQGQMEGKEDEGEEREVEGEGVDESACPYGVLLYTCVIRDLAGVGFEHVGAKGQEIIQAVIGVASANYPGYSFIILSSLWCGVRMWCGVVWYVVVGWGVVWYGMLWYGVARCGVVWCVSLSLSSSLSSSIFIYHLILFSSYLIVTPFLYLFSNPHHSISL